MTTVVTATWYLDRKVSAMRQSAGERFGSARQIENIGGAMKKVISKQYRQGDVLLVAIEQPSRTGKQIDLESGRVTLARGEIAAPNRVEPRA
jgi:hypothetical protein